MKQRFFKYFSIVWLTLAVSAVPVFTCACVEPVVKSHACCPENAQHAPQPAKTKHACCEFHGVAPQKMEGTFLEQAPLWVAYGLAPEAELSQTKVFQPFFHPQFYEGEFSTSPPSLFLKHHSFLL